MSKPNILAPIARRKVIRPTLSLGPKNYRATFSNASLVLQGSNDFISKQASLANLEASSQSRKLTRSIVSTKSTSSVLSNQQNTTEPPQVIRIKCISNWGDPTQLSLASIMLCDKNNHNIPIVHAFLTPYENDPIRIQSLKTLFNSVIVKDSKWTTEFPLPDHLDLFINFAVPAYSEVCSIRIWNPTEEAEKGLKDFQVIQNQKVVITGQVPIKFCLNCQFPQAYSSYNPNYKIPDPFPKFEKPVLEDSFGIYPLIPTKTLKFEIRSTFDNPRTDYFGINSIVLYDHQGLEVPMDALANLSLSGCLHCTNIETLFKENRYTQLIDEMFTATTKWETNPVIKIVFKVPTRLTKIVFYNYNAVGENRHCGISRGKFTNDYGTIWIGNFHEASGSIADVEKCVTTILFTDAPVQKPPPDPTFEFHPKKKQDDKFDLNKMNNHIVKFNFDETSQDSFVSLHTEIIETHIPPRYQRSESEDED